MPFSRAVCVSKDTREVKNRRKRQRRMSRFLGDNTMHVVGLIDLKLIIFDLRGSAVS